jgi:hypothetical protein
MRRLLKFVTAVALVVVLGALTAVILIRMTVTREGVVVPDLIGKESSAWSSAKVWGRWPYQPCMGSHGGMRNLRWNATGCV